MRVRAVAVAVAAAGLVLAGCGSSGGTAPAKSSRPAADCPAAVGLARGLAAAQATFAATGTQAQIDGLRSAAATLRSAVTSLRGAAGDLIAMADAYDTIVREGGPSAPAARQAVAAAAGPTERVLAYVSAACPEAAAVIQQGSTGG